MLAAQKTQASSPTRVAAAGEQARQFQPKYESTYDWMHNATAAMVMNDVSGEVRVSAGPPRPHLGPPA